jgi:hypothetical protein
MLNHLDPASALAMGLLVFALIMVILFERPRAFMMRPMPSPPSFTPNPYSQVRRWCSPES